MITRRKFLQNSGAVAGSAILAATIPTGLMSFTSPGNLSFGFQTWTLRDELGKDLPGTLRKMANMGYKEVEMCSPLGYTGTPFEKFNHLTGFELRKIIEDAGLKCESSHYNMGELRTHLDNRIEWSQQMGITQIIASSFWLPQNASVDDYRRAADELNEIGRKTKAAGIQAGFHNHHMEFEKRGDELIYDALLDQLDPDLVKMQFQFAVINIGYKAADYFRKHPGRFISIHLADLSPAQNKSVAIGQGVVDWEDFFRAAKVGGVKNFYVEMDPEVFKESVEYLTRF
jgi:sugar phosphate isomerase/epimerase